MRSVYDDAMIRAEKNIPSSLSGSFSMNTKSGWYRVEVIPFRDTPGAFKVLLYAGRSSRRVVFTAYAGFGEYSIYEGNPSDISFMTAFASGPLDPQRMRATANKLDGVRPEWNVTDWAEVLLGTVEGCLRVKNG